MDRPAPSSPAPTATRLTMPAGRSARLRLWLAGPRGLVALALLVGLGAGVGAIGFRLLIEGLTQLFAGTIDYSAVPGAANPHVPWLGGAFVLVTPVLGGLLYGPLVARYAPEARGHGVPEVMLAVSESGGRIRPQVPAVKALASALTIGSGGSVGREGPIVQIGSALGSVLGQAVRVPEERLRLLVACGAAGGIAATFNAPVAGVFFALEVILRDFETRSFGVVVVAAVTADAVARSVVGSESSLTLPTFELTSAIELVAYAGLGAVAGVVGVAFIRILYGGEDLADRLWRGPEWARPAAGGLLLGLLLLAVPEMYGVGYPVLSNAVGGQYVIGFVLLLLVAKVLATSLTVAIGGSGGVFAPSLFMGAMLGAAFGQGIHALLPGLTAPAGAYALVGMGAVFAGSARAPITAVLIIFELTGEYTVILPLMLAVVVATAVSEHLSSDTIYTLKLRRRGIRVDRPRVASVMRTVTVAEALVTVPPALHADAGLDQILAHMSEHDDAAVPVVDRDGALVGILTAATVETFTTTESTTAGALAHAPSSLAIGSTLEQAVQALAWTEDPGLPVTGEGGEELVGWITHRSVLRAYHRERDRLTPSAPRDLREG